VNNSHWFVKVGTWLHFLYLFQKLLCAFLVCELGIALLLCSRERLSYYLRSKALAMENTEGENNCHCLYSLQPFERWSEIR